MPSGFVTLVVIGAWVAMSGCGADRDVGEPATSGSDGFGSGAASSVTADSTTGESAPPPGTAGEAGSPVPFTKGEVSVRLGADHYPLGAVVHVTVSNGLDRPV